MIIGLTGTLCAGKGTIAEFLKEKGFEYYSLSDEIRKELDSLGLERTRANLIDKANELREMYGAGALAKRVLYRLSNRKTSAVVDGIRNPEEVRELRKRPDFYLLGIDSSQRARFKRMLKRKRGEKDPETLEEFRKLDQSDRGIGTPETAQQVGKTMKMADAIILNNSSLKKLQEKLGKALSDFQKRHNNYKRPSWDEYFMEVARIIAKRSTCDRGRSGCVIARDRQLLVSGYVGSPVGFSHCDEIGHYMKKLIHEDGRITQHCLRTVHAEQNAVCQAAKLGTSLSGATLYCKMTPCRTCAMLIINCGIKRVVCEKKYHSGEDSEKMFKQAGVKLEYFDESVEKYDNQ